MYTCLECEKEVSTSKIVCDCGCKLIEAQDSEVDSLIVSYRNKKNNSFADTVLNIPTVDEKAWKVTVETSVSSDIKWSETIESINNSKRWISTNPEKIRGINYWCMSILTAFVVLLSSAIPYIEIDNSGVILILASFGIVFILFAMEYITRYIERESYDRLPMPLILISMGLTFVFLINLLLVALVKYELLIANHYNKNYFESLSKLVDVYILNSNIFIFLLMAPIVLVLVGILSLSVAFVLFKFLSEMMSDTNIHQSSKKAGVVTGILNTAMDGRSAGIGSAARGFLFGYGISALIQIVLLMIIFGVIFSLGVGVLSLPFTSVELLGEFVFHQTKGPFSFAGFINSILILTTIVLAAVNFKVNGRDYSDYNFWVVKRTHLTYSFVGLNLVWIPLIYLLAKL